MRDDWDFPIGRGFALPDGATAVQVPIRRPIAAESKAVLRKAIDDLIAVVVDVAGEDADVVTLMPAAAQVRTAMKPVTELVQQLERGGG